MVHLSSKWNLGCARSYVHCSCYLRHSPLVRKRIPRCTDRQCFLAFLSWGLVKLIIRQFWMHSFTETGRRTLGVCWGLTDGLTWADVWSREKRQTEAWSITKLFVFFPVFNNQQSTITQEVTEEEDSVRRETSTTELPCKTPKFQLYYILNTRSLGQSICCSSKKKWLSIEKLLLARRSEVSGIFLVTSLGLAHDGLPSRLREEANKHGRNPCCTSTSAAPGRVLTRRMCLTIGFGEKIGQTGVCPTMQASIKRSHCLSFAFLFPGRCSHNRGVKPRLICEYDNLHHFLWLQ